MKVKCRDGYPYELTVGNIYNAEIVIVPGGFGTAIKFFIYNDGKQWDTYSPEAFTPIDEHNEILNVLRGNTNV